MRRRRYVAMVGSASLAGCLGRLGETDEAETDEKPPDEETTTERATVETDSGSFQRLWAADLEDGDGGFTANYQATADAETAYLGTPSHLIALSLADGTEQWTLSLDTPVNGVLIDDDGLFTLHERTVQRVDPVTGESRWTSTGAKRPGAGDFYAATDDHVVASGEGGVRVFEKESGQQTATLTSVLEPVRAWNGQFVVVDASGLTAYDPDGTAQWTIDDVSVNWLSPVVGSTVVGGGSGTFVGVDLEQGEQAWTTGADGSFRRPRTAGTDDTVFISPRSAGGFSALDPETGDVRWQNDDIYSASFSPVVLESGLVFPETFGIQAIDLETGRQLAATDQRIDIQGVTGSGRTVVGYGDRAFAYRL
jgi:outer membrane protein assembly factor BamB